LNRGVWAICRFIFDKNDGCKKKEIHFQKNSEFFLPRNANGVITNNVKSIERMIMKKIYFICGLLLFLTTGTALVAILCFDKNGLSLFGAARSPDPSTTRPPIKAIMIRGFRENNTSLLGRIGQALEEKEIPWNDVQRDSSEIAALAKEMQTYSPGKGESDSWRSLTSQLAQSATELANAARKKDREACKIECGKIAASCAACHDAHR
jgi:cytochrome c553